MRSHGGVVCADEHELAGGQNGYPGRHDYVRGLAGTARGQYFALMLEFTAADPMAVGVDEVPAVSGNTAMEPEQGAAVEQLGSGW